MTAGRAFVATWKEVLGSKPLLGTMLLAIVLYAFYYPAPYSHQVAQSLPVIVVDEENSGATRAIVRDIEATRGVKVVGEVPSLVEARARMTRGEADGVVLLSRGLMRTLRTGAPGGGVAIWVNAMYSLRASTIGSSVEEVLRSQPQETRGLRGSSSASFGPPITVRVEPLFNRTAGYKGYIFPAVAVIIAQQTLLFGSATFMAGRRQQRRWSFDNASFVGTWAALTSIGCLGVMFLFTIAFWLQDVPRGGNPAALLVSVPPFSAAVAALGLLLGSFMDRAERGMAILAPTSVPAFFLSGTAWPLDQMPRPVVWLASLLPSTGGVHLFVPLNQMAAGLGETWPALVTICALAFCYGLLAWVRLTRRRHEGSTAGELDSPPG